MLLIFLTNCSSAPKKTVVNKPVAEVKIEKSALEQALVQAKQANQTQNWLTAIEQLIKVNQQLIVQQSWQKAYWLSQQLQQFDLPEHLQLTVLLLKAQAEQALTLVESMQTTLALVQPFLAQANRSQRYQYFQQKWALDQLIAIELKVQVADLLELQALTTEPNLIEQQALAIWQRLIAMSPWQLSLLKQQKLPNAKAWLALVNMANQYGSDELKFNRYLTAWQRQYRQHSANLIAKQLLEQPPNLTHATINNIAVLLPLSGPQKAAGIALQQGMLAAYQAPQTLHFIDTNQLDFNQLASQLEQLSIDGIIGPLLKTNVQQLLTANIALPTLLLNTIDNSSLAANQFAISMQPEDEAIQAAAILANKQFKHPLVISHNDAVSKRIADSFVAQWQKTTGEVPELMLFDQGNNMQAQVQQALDVALSQDRIASLKRRVNRTLETETRNRRDLDMVYLIGTPTQTRLLKPYIDVNISPFANTMPIYASSRSHGKIIDQKDFRDLRGIIFTEMPWLLPSNQQNKQLAQQAQTVWPNRSDNLQRIFALGYDSLALFALLPQMQQARYIRFYGQTGIMQLNDNNVISRSLLWGKYTTTRVKSTRM